MYLASMLPDLADCEGCNNFHYDNSCIASPLIVVHLGGYADFRFDPGQYRREQVA